MDIKDELINTAVNSVGPGLSFGSPKSDSLLTDDKHVYRITGMDQIDDIKECGYVRPKGYGTRSNRVGHKIYWSIGGEKVFYIDTKRAIIEAPKEKVKDGQIGAIPITDLSAVWVYDINKMGYENILRDILIEYRAKQVRKNK